MKKILLGLVFLLIGNNIFAQTMGTINGVVKDKNTQEVLIQQFGIKPFNELIINILHNID